MRITIVCLLCAVTVAAGCASFDQQYVNWRGQTHDCDQFGFGLVGAKLANQTHQTCADSMQELGYLNTDSTGLVGIALTQAMSVAGSEPVTIQSVEPDSSAAMAGLQVGDQVLELDGQVVSSLRIARQTLFGKAGSAVLIKTRRGYVTSVDELVRQPRDSGAGNEPVARATSGPEAPY